MQTRERSGVVVGGGLVGLATAAALARSRPDLHVTVLEKESTLAAHQSGNNSGVVHSGVYYTPGSVKAVTCRRGRQLLLDHAERHDIDIDICGKVIVATDDSQRMALDDIARRGRANGVQVTPIGPGRLRELEPHVRGVAALHVADAGIVDYPALARTLAAQITESGGTVRTGTTVVSGHEGTEGVTITTTTGEVRADVVVTCAGLHSDVVARAFGATDVSLQIIPFRGEYFRLRPQARRLCRSLIYPVPDPRFPFLGVHLTRHISGHVLAGPNAVLGLAREGYRWRDIDAGDLRRMAASQGLRQLARQHWRTGIGEMWRSVNRRAFVRALQQMTPAISPSDIEPYPAGVRAQALYPDGTLADDFVFHETPRTLHVLNAPSPAATSCLAIGEQLSAQALGRIGS